MSDVIRHAVASDYLFDGTSLRRNCAILIDDQRRHAALPLIGRRQSRPEMTKRAGLASRVVPPSLRAVGAMQLGESLGHSGALFYFPLGGLMVR